MQSSVVTLRANYWRPIGILAAATATAMLALLTGTIPQPYVAVIQWILLVSGLMLLTLAIAAVFSFIRLTDEGFSEPIHLLRVLRKWSDVGTFHVVDKRFLGIRFRGVGFNYVKSNAVLDKRRHRFGYDRIIDHSYGEPSELARVLNQWRARSVASPEAGDRDASD
jgi:hypothetical protein